MHSIHCPTPPIVSLASTSDMIAALPLEARREKLNENQNTDTRP
jgi:hypothetical protein